MNTYGKLTSRGLYAVTNGPRSGLLEATALALEGGARMLQYRDLSQDAERRLAEAGALAKLCHAHHVPLIIDHDIALAIEVGADGVHLGRGDEAPATVRRTMGEHAIIGVSCYDSLARAQAAADAGASYVSFGAFFPSTTKPLASLVSIELLRQSAALGIPRVAIGGITPDNGRLLVEAGAEYLAVVAAVLAAPDVRAAAQRFTDLYSSDRETA
ncbi:thiamine phosphate synthase [Rhodanobacter sp. AS-Z3]|uniref:thiamine phosphate synthase n=1 Tax=Rhodanobacter sp. AS-Z3 TaxID=3031330 RepID=UPI0024783F38|nr:thiamine phosphate synthase [Rhodanobacter sp. AS-Z3]WEN15137.1 thiamine phosphate synthase [Rhodanobacter sp. AS-Z3]